MALKRMLLIPPEVWEKCSQPSPSSPPPVKKILKSNDHSFDKWTKVRMIQDPYLKSEKVKREPIPIPIVETGGTPESKPIFKTKPKRKRVIGSVPLFQTESPDTGSETDTGGSPAPSKYIESILRRRGGYDPMFGVYQDHVDGSFKIGSLNFKYNDKHVFVDGKKYVSTPGLWELLTRWNPDNNKITQQDRQVYKDILVRSNAHRVDYNPTGRIRANKGNKYRTFISKLFTDLPNSQIAWETL